MRMLRFQLPALALLCAVAFGADPASAHTGSDAVHGFGVGILHPLTGLDHVLAMVATGLWAGLAGGAARLAWPAAFLAVMLAGAIAGIHGSSLPGIETAIALSVVAAGLAVALRPAVPVLLGALACGLFAFAHGHAHGAELPGGADAAAYMAGFLASTVLLHAAGLATGRLVGGRAWLPGIAGAGVAATGIVLLTA
jgi:urease accessory protein